MCTWLPVLFCCSSLPPHPHGDPSARRRAHPSLNPLPEGWRGMPPHSGMPVPLPPAISSPLLGSPHAASAFRGASRLSPLPANSFPVRSPCSRSRRAGPAVAAAPRAAARGQRRPAPAPQLWGLRAQPGQPRGPTALHRGAKGTLPPPPGTGNVGSSCEGCETPRGSLLEPPLPTGARSALRRG